MNVTYFQRAPQQGFSVEQFFDDVRQGLPSDILTRVVCAKFKGTSPPKVVWNAVLATFHQGEINHVTGDAYYMGLLLRKNRTLLTILDCVSLERLRGWRKWVFCLLWYRLPIRRAAAVAVISESTKQQLLRYVRCAPEKIHVVHCCISSDFQAAPKSFNVARPVILQVGTSLNKNVERIAESVRDISCHLRIIGVLTAEQKAALQRSGVACSTVANISRKELIAEYEHCDMLIFASTYEGFGIPIVEAQAMGRPVVTSNLLSMPEVAGDGACLVDPYDVGSIRAGVLRVIEDPAYRGRLVSAGLENVGRFRAHAIAEQYARLYRQLANGARIAGET